jgi:hypothetical protein
VGQARVCGREVKLLSMSMYPSHDWRQRLMFRTMSAIVAVLAVGLFVLAAGAAPPTLPLGEKFEGEIREMNNRPLQHALAKGGYTAEVPVTLKAGQSISISVTVVGKDRQVGIELQDPTGKSIRWTKGAATKTSQLEVEEVSAAGKYTIVVLSDRIGPFTLRATDPSDAQDRVKQLEDRIKRLKEELAKAEDELKALKESRELKTKPVAKPKP